jgi:putative pyruvate formate lyase activating enzyme
MGYGNDVGVPDLAGMMLDLERRGAHNINLVTATHYLPHAVEAIVEARASGLTIPVISNTSGYERTETVRMLDGLVQVYLVDMRYARAESSARYSQTPDYPENNRAAVREMVELAGPLKRRDGLAETGVIIRHLLLPTLLEETRDILGFVSTELSVTVPVSLMTQYFPANRASEFPEIDRKITLAEYEKALDLLDGFRICDGWVQDPHTCTSPVT